LEVAHSELQTYCDGTLSGSFPMTVKWSQGRYCESNGKETLKSIGADRAADFSTLDTSLAHKNEAIRLWLAELERLNPGLSRVGVLPLGQRVLLPDEAAMDDLISKRLASFADAR